MKRHILLLLTAFVLALALAACGGSEPAAEAPADEAPTAEAPADEAQAPAEEAPAEESAELACTDELGCVEVAPGDPIRIASSLVVSGPNTELGLDSQYGVEIALDFRMGRCMLMHSESGRSSTQDAHSESQAAKRTET